MNPLESPLFTERVAFLLASQYWSKERLEDYQLRRLRHLVKHAEQHVPFYRELMRSKGMTWEDIRTLSDVRRFPLIDKRTIQNDYDSFIADNADKSRLMTRTTGGSTGTPLTVYSDDDFHARDKANTEHYMNVFDLDIFTHRSVRLYGDKIPRDLPAKGEYWYLAEGRRLVMSCYHITRGTAPAYVAKIGEFGPIYIHTRPSSILPLANYIHSEGFELKGCLRAIFCDGEYLTAGQRHIIERAFKTRLINIYGHTEGCAVGHPCKESDQLHFLPQVGLLELLDSAGEEVTEAGGKGEMVVTGFNNLVFPLIRYRTGDIAVLGDKRCACRRHYKLIREVEGRIQDYVVDRHGNLIPLAPAIFNYNDMDWKGIREFRVRQEKEGALTITIQPERELLADADGARVTLERRMGAILGENFTVAVEFVEDIPKTRIGKHRYLDQKLDLSGYFHL